MTERSRGGTLTLPCMWGKAGLATKVSGLMAGLALAVTLAKTGEPIAKTGEPMASALDATPVASSSRAQVAPCSFATSEIIK